MKINKIEGKIVLFFQFLILHFIALLSKIYLLTNKDLKEKLTLLDEMKGIAPIVYPDIRNSDLKFGYLVRGTSIILRPPNESDSRHDVRQKNKYNIFIGLAEDPWEQSVNLEYVFDHYPDKIKQNFLFNLTKFN